MMRRVLCVGLVLLAGLGVAFALELGELIKDYGAQNGSGLAIFATDRPGIRAAVVYSDDDESGAYSEGDTVVGVRYFGVLRDLSSETTIHVNTAPSFGVRR